MLGCHQQVLHRSINVVMGSCLGSKRTRPQRQRCGKRLQVVAVGWDPEGILRAPQGHHISRRTMQKQVEDDKELQKKMEKEQTEIIAKMDEARQGRRQPTSHSETVEYFLSTEAEEMQYEVARCRPMLDQPLFEYLDNQIAQQRFAKTPNADKLAELEALRDFLKSGVKALDDRTQQVTAPAERLKTLLMSKDKKACIHELAESNQIDEPLLNLLQQNINAARAANQAGPAEFMEKIRDAARKFVLK